MKFGDWLEYLFSPSDKDYRPSTFYRGRSLTEYTNLANSQRQSQEVTDIRRREGSFSAVASSERVIYV